LNEFIELLSKHRVLFGKRALDIGCGGGISTFALEKLGLNVVGLDSQEEMIKMANKAAREINSKAIFIHGNLEDMPEETLFDSIFMLGNVLAHISVFELNEMLIKLKGLLRKSGVLVIHYADTIGDILNKEFFVVNHGASRSDIEFTYDIENGAINITVIEKKIREDLYEAERFKIFIWAPWILEIILNNEGFHLMHREYLPRNMVLDIYKKLD